MAQDDLSRSGLPAVSRKTENYRNSHITLKARSVKMAGLDIGLMDRDSNKHAKKKNLASIQSS